LNVNHNSLLTKKIIEMSELKRQKWDKSEAVTKGKQSLTLLETYNAELSPRFSEEKQEEHTANVGELEKRIPGQVTTLSGQKSTTAAQNEIIKTIGKRVGSIRNIVGANASQEIKKAFGVGSKYSLTVMGVAGAVDTIVKAYNQYTAWSNGAGIIAKDITELTALEASLYSADDKQGVSIYARKAATMDKNTLQRAVEDGVTKISALGIQEFELTNPAVAKLFADLIPSSPSAAKKASAKAKPKPAAV
jgi:hypothetical protein